MANVQELINRLEYLVDDNVSPDIAVMLFNMAMEDLSEVAGYVKTAEAEFYRGQESLTLPDDVVEIEEIRFMKAGEKRFNRILLDNLIHKYEELPPGLNELARYELIGNQIYLMPHAPYNGRIRVRYYALLPEIPVDLNYRPKIKAAFHRALPLYAAAKYMQNWKDELNAKVDFMNEYEIVKSELCQNTLERKQKSKSQFVIKTRSWY